MGLEIVILPLELCERVRKRLSGPKARNITAQAEVLGMGLEIVILPRELCERVRKRLSGPKARNITAQAEGLGMGQFKYPEA